MRGIEKVSLAVILVLILCLLYAVAAYDVLEERLLEVIEDQRMKNVVITDIEKPQAVALPKYTAVPVMIDAEAESEPLLLPEMESVGGETVRDAEAVAETKADGNQIKETTIRGWLSIKN